MESEFITALVLIWLIIGLVKDLLPPVVLFFSALFLLALTNVVDSTALLSGFSSEIIVIIGSMFILSYALQKTIDINAFVSTMLGKSNNRTAILTKLMSPAALSSAIINNTPVVASLIQPVIQWSNKNKISASYLLIPLSYAAIIGGTFTLIGTSTNLVASGVMKTLGYEGFSFFELTYLSLPIGIILIAFIALFAYKFLKPSEYAQINPATITKYYTLEAKPTSEIIGKTVKEAGLRNLRDIFLIGIERSNGDKVAPVEPNRQIRQGDRLLFSGELERLVKLEKHSKIEIVGHKHSSKIIASSTYYEVIIGTNSPLTDNTLKSIGFRNKYQSGVLAIYRSGERIINNLGDLKLQPGDSLLLLSSHNFEEIWQDRSDFLYIREISKTKATSKKQGYLIIGIIGLVLMSIAVGLPLAQATLMGALLCVILRLLNYEQLKKSLHIDVLLLVGAALSLANAVEVSGLAAWAGDQISGIGFLTNPIGLLIAFVFLTTIMTELVTNVSAVSIVLPIAVSTAINSGVDPYGVAIAVTVAASLSFISPFGYQTNTIVYSAGGYKYWDFVRIGIIVSGLAIILNLIFSSLLFY